ncbi:methyltransferase [Aliiroseovarius subalbicans]|uniref:tRNA1(Val) (adenine(37)-N6)-methyltransferase n=1 Tax=Aliiroseovarius subalbicans TaxID=2925840 RepID=UPI001F5A532E|nr:methyltransferase [Aliiroseovarius subalbicans]MCI2399557.1 methyltransferase [Aliiroseovarius subalbicans]
MGVARNAVTADKFLGGDVMLLQPRDGYRAGVDPVFLAASITAHNGQSVLDIGCGVGAAALCLGRRVPGLRLVGVERQTEYADLAEKNAFENNVGFEVHNCDLTALPGALREENFDHVIMNPPYHLRDRGTAAANPGREAALGEGTPLVDWVDTATKRLKPKGFLTMIQKAERLPEILGAMDDRLGSVLVKPLCPREGRAAGLVLVQARKGGRGAFRLATPLILHDGVEHVGDRESYRPEVSAILRDGAALPLW